MKTYQVVRLTEARLKKGWTKSELARRVGVSVPTISRVESGENQSPGTIARIAAKLGLPLGDLVR